MKHSNIQLKIMELPNLTIFKVMTDKCNNFLFKTHHSLEIMLKKHKVKSRMLIFYNCFRTQ